MCDFRHGDVVVCIDDGPHRHTRRPCPYTKGRAYTVRKTVLHDKSGLRAMVVSDLPIEDQLYLWGTPGGPTALHGWITDRFRRVYRPDGTLTASLLKPRKVKA
jgi:hypothetical protein